MKKLLPLLSLYCLSSAAVLAASYDIVIKNGRVMDPETKFDEVRNVGITEGKIITITEEDIQGAEVLDAEGLVVAPGFIDTHTHSSDKFSIKMSMMDGVTTGLDLEAGAVHIAAWYEREKGKWPFNYGQAVCHEMVRMMVHDGLTFDEPVDAYNLFTSRAKAGEDGLNGWSVTVSNLDQINEINHILDENLRQGAIGIGCTPGYASAGISTYEQFEVQRTAARYKRLCAIHTRLHGSTKPPLESQMGFMEVLSNAMLLQAPLLICHNNDYGWWEAEEKLSMARDRGYNVWSEYYPYAAASTSIGADVLKPASLEYALGLKYEEVLYDPTQDKKLNKEEYLQVVKEDPGRTIVVFNPPRFEWMKSWIKIPHMTVGSDAMWSTDPSLTWDSDPSKFSGHPRTSGSHATVLRQAREADIPLMFTLAQLSYWSAKHLGDSGLESMQVRGRLQEGMVADITIFDADEVKEGSSYKAGEQGLPPMGIPHVMVNGTLVKKDHHATGAFPGVAIRFPEEETARHKPASKKQWLKTFTIDGGSLAPRRSKTAHVIEVEHDECKTAVAGSGLWGTKPFAPLGSCCPEPAAHSTQ